MPGIGQLEESDVQVPKRGSEKSEATCGPRACVEIVTIRAVPEARGARTCERGSQRRNESYSVGKLCEGHKRWRHASFTKSKVGKGVTSRALKGRRCARGKKANS